MLPNSSRTSPATDCVALGLVPAPGQTARCAVPAGMQYWVWSNLSDLPQGATVDATITVRPNATTYPVGSNIDFNVAAFTSSVPTMLPVFDGSTSVAKTTAHNSGRGTGTDTTLVRALRVTKSEPSPEDELLRGVHNNVTTYTIKVESSGQAATDTVTVTDYLPAGLEYLGVSGGDNSAAGTEEFPGSGRIPGVWVPTGEQVETVQLSASEATALGLAGAGVYTKVTWTIPSLSGGTPQAFPGTPGTPRELSFSYQAAVPLFENALWPAGTAPTPASGAQGANLDNNMGASTRHGSTDPANPAQAQTLKNVVTASGNYAGAVAGNNAALRAQTDRDSETVDAVDLRVLKSVQTDDGDAFATDKLARYTLDVASSEYVDSSGITLTDVIPNGLCTAFPEQAVAPKLFITSGNATEKLARTVWNSRVTPGSQCNYPSVEADATLTNATVDSITFNADTGTFTVVFAVADMPANGRVLVDYTLMQRPDYTGSGGATSSGDTMTNHVTVAGTTTPIAAIANDPALAAKVGDKRYAMDDSQATIGSSFTHLEKTVLERGKTLANADPADWVDAAATPFSPGDRVWYRIKVPFAEGIDTRNPILEDFLPEGIEFVGAQYGWTGIPGVADQVDPVDISPGAGFPNAYVRTPVLASGPDSMTWALGAQNRENRLGSADRFMPLDSTVTVYVEARVTGQSNSAGDVDSPLNHAKYQQVNVDGEVSFRRADAGIDLDWGSTLKKGIRTNPHAGGSTDAVFDSARTNELVAQGDQVVYRLDVTASQNVSGKYVVWDVLPAGVRAADVGAFASALVDGGAEAPLSSGQFSAAAYDTVPAGGPALSGQYAGRSVIIWTLNDSVAVPGSTADVPGSTPAVTRGLTFGYTLTVPAGGGAGGAAAQITQSYLNTAGIVSYAFANNGSSGSTTVVPQEIGDGAVKPLTDRTPAVGEIGVGNLNTVASAEVHLPSVTPTKKLVSTEVGPLTADARGTVGLHNTDDANNTQSRIVQGEYATFEYAIKIPANTTVKGAALYDNGAFAVGGGGSIRYEFVANSAKFFGPNNATSTPDTCGSGDLVGFGCLQSNGPAGSAQRGVLRFPDNYTNNTAQDQTFRAQVTVWVKDRDANPANSAATQLANNAALTNTATFGFEDPNAAGQRISRTATAQAQFAEPQATIAKTASSANVDANGGVSYTLTANNASGRAALYDVTVYDCVPSEITVTANSFVRTPAVADGSAAIVAGEKCEIVDGKIVRGAVSDPSDPGETKTGTLIKWTIPQLDGGATATLTYAGTVTSVAGGGASFTNYAELTGYTLPAALGFGNDTTDRRGVYKAQASAAVKLSDAALVKTVTPSSAPVGETVTYTLTTTLPAHVNFYDVTLRDTLPAGLEYVPSGAHTESVNWAGAANAPTVGVPSVSGQTMTWAINANDILLHDEARTITVTFQAKITGAATDAAPRNVGTFGWDMVNGDTATGTSTTGDASVTLLNPAPAIRKDVKLRSEADAAYRQGATGNPDQAFTYRVTVPNAGNTPAHNVTVIDAVPSGVVVDAATITNGGVLTGNNAVTGGGTITWTNLGPVAVGANNALQMTYSATFAPSANMGSGATGQGTLRANVANVTHYESFATGGRSYDPPLTGAGSISDTADVRALFPLVSLGKTVTSGNVAYANQPFGWTLRATNVGTGSALNIEMRDRLPMNWNYHAAGAAEIRVDGVGAWLPLAAPAIGADARDLTWSEGKIRAALGLTGTPGTAVLAGKTVTKTPYFDIRFSATPNEAALTDSGVTESDGTRVPHTNTLSATAKDTSGATGNQSYSTYAPGSAQASAYLHAADLSIDKADGELRAGTTGTGWTITVTNNGPDTAVGPITVTDQTAPLPAGITVTGATGAGWTCGAVTKDADTLRATFTCVRTNANESLAKDASFPRINVQVRTDANVASGTSVENSATVSTGGTHDPTPGNNTDTGTLDVSTTADLAIMKTLASAGVKNAGDPISWNLALVNNGPSDSLSVTGNLITITDTVPASVGTVSVGTLPAGWTLAQDGNEITLTLDAGNRLASGATVNFTVSGAILPGTEAGTEIENSVTVTPGSTTDPILPNNDDSVTTAPTTATASIAAVKTRGALVDGAWVVAAAGDVPAGQQVSYLLSVTNTGTADVRGAQITDAFTSYLRYENWQAYPASETLWTAAHVPLTNTATFTLGRSLAPGESASVIVTTTVAPDYRGAVFNQSCVDATNKSETGNVLCAQTSSDSDKIVDWELVKTHVDPDLATPEVESSVAGGSVRYQLALQNHGPSASDGPITVTDTLPLGFSYQGNDSATVNGASATLAPPAIGETADGRVTVTWTVPGLINVAEDAVAIAFDAGIAENVNPGVYENSATVVGLQCPTDPVDPACKPELDPNPGNNTDTDEVTVARSASFAIQKQVELADGSGTWGETAEKVAGRELNYLVTVTNNGPSAAPVNFADALPAGMTLVSVQGADWTCDTVDDAPDGAPTGECAYTGAGGLHPVGSSTITVRALLASNVLPTELPDRGPLVNTASIDWVNSPDVPATTTASDTAEITVATDADLGIVKDVITGAGGDVVADPAAAVAGETAWYRLQVTNHGASDATGAITVTDVLPAGVTVPTTLIEAGDWVVAASDVDPATGRQTVVFTLAGGQVAATAAAPDRGVAPVIEFEVNLDSVVADGTLTNEAGVASPTADSNPDNNADVAELAVHREVDLAITKSHNAEAVHLDQEVPFTLMVSNVGPSLASGVTVTDIVPFGLTVKDVPGDEVGDGWSVVSVDAVDAADTALGTRVVASWSGELGVSAPDNGAPALTLTTLVTVDAYESVTNTADVTAAEITPEYPDRDPANNHAEDAVTVPPLATLVVEKTAVGTFQVGGTGAYRITVSNEGPTEDPGPITVTDVLPDGLTFASSPDAGVTVSGKAVTWSIDGLAVGESVELTLIVNVQQAAFPSVTNVVEVASPTELTENSVTLDDATIAVAAADPLPTTGSDQLLLLGAIALLLLLGGGALVVARRRRALSE